MDNRQIDVTSQGREALALAMEIIWDNAPGGKATHYRVMNLRRQIGDGLDEKLVEDPDGTPTMILLWHEEGNQESSEMAYPHSREQATGFVRGWLGSVEYGPEPDHDGSNGKGWRVFNEYWGHVAGYRYAIVAVQPAWAMYGK